MKLNGWKRIGIVASVVWIIGAYGHTMDTALDADAKFSVEIVQSCISAHNGQEVGDNECLKRGEDYVVNNIHNNQIAAALVAIVPVPLGWGFAYLVIFLVRWIKRGFV